MRLSTSSTPKDVSWRLVLITAITATAQVHSQLQAMTEQSTPPLWPLVVLVAYLLTLSEVWRTNGNFKRCFYGLGGGLLVAHLFHTGNASVRYDVPIEVAFDVLFPYTFATGIPIAITAALVFAVRLVIVKTKRGDDS